NEIRTVDAVLPDAAAVEGEAQRVLADIQKAGIRHKAKLAPVAVGKAGRPLVEAAAPHIYADADVQQVEAPVAVGVYAGRTSRAGQDDRRMLEVAETVGGSPQGVDALVHKSQRQVALFGKAKDSEPVRSVRAVVKDGGAVKLQGYR